MLVAQAFQKFSNFFVCTIGSKLNPWPEIFQLYFSGICYCERKYKGLRT